MKMKDIKKEILREEWLRNGMKKLSEVFKHAKIEVPEDIEVSCGFPLTGGKGSRNQTIGNCFPRSASEKKINEIFISPVLSDSIRVLDVLTHEMIHAIDDCKNGHKAPFRKMALAVGLTGKMTKTVAGDELKTKLEKIVVKLGDYPHATLDAGATKKQGTRNIKVTCCVCDFSYRTSRKNVESMTNTTCNGCGDASLEIS
jgi:hypothetical protein